MKKNKNLMSADIEKNTTYYLENIVRRFILVNLYKILAEIVNLTKSGKISLLDALFYLVMSQMNGNISRFCRKVGLPVFDFINLYSEKNLISLRQLITICYPSRVSLVSLLEGSIARGLSYDNFKDCNNKQDPIEKYSRMFIDTAYKSQKISKDEIERAKSFMKDLLNKDPVSFSTVSHIVNIKPGILKRLLPVLSWQLSSRNKEYIGF